MHKKYFPKCQVNKPIEPPVPYDYAKIGAIPNKCGNCEYLFEGECNRGSEFLNRYLHLDFGPCGINGPTDPVIFQNDFITSKVEIPRKCTTCRHLVNDSIYGFTCNKDSDKWGENYRGLDWGNWQPNAVYMDLPLPKITSREMHKYVNEKNLPEFIKEYRKANLGLSIQEAKDDYNLMISKMIKFNPGAARDATHL